MKSFKSYFVFTRMQRNGLFVLVTLMLLLQLCYHFIDFSAEEPDSVEKREWLALQEQIDSLQRQTPPNPAKYPFNPNFITDYKGYRLGMSLAEIDRLHAFRKQGKFVNSAGEFQEVTKVSDSLLAAIAPDFKFPDWVTTRQKAQSRRQIAEGGRRKADRRWQTAENKWVVKDINLATKEDLMAIYGIGEALSDRILKQREILGGFVSMSQMADVWGLSPEVIEKLNERFAVRNLPAVAKVRINDAPVSILAKFPYFRYALAKEIVTYRSMNGGINGVADLAKIKNFPVEKVDIIAVYLEF